MNERLKLFIEYLKECRIVHNFADFASEMGKNRSIISEMINDKRIISESFVRKICNKYPQLNADWLLTGEGNMLIDSGSQPEPQTAQTTSDKAQIDRLLTLLESQNTSIKALIQLVESKDEQIDKLTRELDARKKGTAPSAGSSSDAVAG